MSKPENQYNEPDVVPVDVEAQQRELKRAGWERVDRRQDCLAKPAKRSSVPAGASHSRSEETACACGRSHRKAEVGPRYGGGGVRSRQQKGPGSLTFGGSGPYRRNAAWP